MAAYPHAQNDKRKQKHILHCTYGQTVLGFLTMTEIYHCNNVLHVSHHKQLSKYVFFHCEMKLRDKIVILPGAELLKCLSTAKFVYRR